MLEDRKEQRCWGEPNPTQEWFDYLAAQQKKNTVQEEEGNE
jgi:hypothetical protein